MIDRLRLAVAPAYLFLCLLLGGSPQGIWRNAILQVLAVLLIAWAIIGSREEGLSKNGRILLGLTAAALLLGLAQLVPLPTAIWSGLPGREYIVQGYALLGLQPRAMPLSLSPYDTISTLLALLPPVGMLAATLVLRAYKPSWLAAALVAGALLGVLLGILQISTPDTKWYLYRIANFGVATGFFANSNHMASLLLASLAFVAALGATLRETSKDARHRWAVLALAGGGLAVVIIGILLNRSLAGYGLGLPVVLASLLMLLGVRSRLAQAAALASCVAALIAIAVVFANPVGSKIGADASIASRQEMLEGSAKLFQTFGMAGSGIGTYAKLYPQIENPGEVGRIYVNHAHNDYLEVAIETGLPGILLIIAFIAWWVQAVWTMLRSPSADHFAIAGAIVSAVILFHSVVDYPLRTAAIGAVFAACLALILQSRRSARSDSDLRPVRHVVVG